VAKAVQEWITAIGAKTAYIEPAQGKRLPARPPKNFAARAASGRGFSTPRAHEGIRRAVAGAALRPFTPGRTGQHAAEENSDRMA